MRNQSGTKARAVVLLSALLLGAGGDPEPATWRPLPIILPPTQGPIVMKQCSRPVPRADAFWEISADTVAEADASLPRAFSRGACSPMRPVAEHARQYVGIEAEGRRQLYVNAWSLVGEEVTPEKVRRWFSNAAVICDGGRSVWGAVYDVKMRRWISAQFNGELGYGYSCKLSETGNEPAG